MNDQHQLFQEIKQTDSNGMELWSARAMSKLLGYSEYRHFQPVITKAKEACANSEHSIEDHFEDVLGMVTIGSGAQSELPTPEQSIKQLESAAKKLGTKNNQESKQ